MFYIRLSENKWLGERGASVPFNGAKSMKVYKSFDGARKALAKAVNSGAAIDGGIYTIDWSKPYCPVSLVMK